MEIEHDQKRIKLGTIFQDEKRKKVMEEFINDTIKNGHAIFGGTIRDMIAEVEPTDIDVYISCKRKFELPAVESFIKNMSKYSFESLQYNENIDWTAYIDWKGRRDQFPAVIMHYNVSYETVSFKVDLVLSKYVPCFGNLDCVVNGLYINSYGISFVCNFRNEKLEQLPNEDLVELAKKLIKERKAGMLLGCDQHRIAKMARKGYNTDVI